MFDISNVNFNSSYTVEPLEDIEIMIFDNTKNSKWEYGVHSDYLKKWTEYIIQFKCFEWELIEIELLETKYKWKDKWFLNIDAFSSKKIEVFLEVS